MSKELDIYREALADAIVCVSGGKISKKAAEQLAQESISEDDLKNTALMHKGVTWVAKSIVNSKEIKYIPASDEDVKKAIDEVSKQYPITSQILARYESAENFKNRIIEYRKKVANDSNIKMVLDLAGNYYSSVVDYEMENDFKIKSEDEMNVLKIRCEELSTKLTKAINAANEDAAQVGLEPLFPVSKGNYAAVAGEIVEAFFITRKRSCF